MLLVPAENMKAPTREEADELAARIREWGQDPDTVNALHASSNKTLDWLKGNCVPDDWLKPDRKYSKLPDPEKRAKDEFIQWWPSPLDYNDACMKEARAVQLRQRAYDLGLLYFLKDLALSGLIKIAWDDIVDEVLLPSTYFGFNQLLAFSRLKVLDRSQYDELDRDARKNVFSSSAVAELFGITSEHRATLFRKKFVRLGSMGLLAGLPARGDAFPIELGPSGETLLVDVFVPIINHMSLQREGIVA